MLLFPPTNAANFPYFGKRAFDLYDRRAIVSINMADIEVGFVNVYEKFGIRALSDYQREAITQFVNNIWYWPLIFAGNLGRIALSISKSVSSVYIMSLRTTFSFQYQN